MRLLAKVSSYGDTLRVRYRSANHVPNILTPDVENWGTDWTATLTGAQGLVVTLGLVWGVGSPVIYHHEAGRPIFIYSMEGESRNLLAPW